MIKLVVKIAVGTLLLVFVAAFISGLFLPVNNLEDCRKAGNCAKVDAIVVVSGGKTVDRVQHGIKLWHENLAQKMVFSGASADPNSPSDASFMRDFAVRQGGVPETAILLDETAYDTTENAEGVAKIIEEQGWKSVILVTSPYHQRRVFLEFQRALKGKGVDIYNSPVETSGAWWLTPKGLWLSAHEWGGIILFHLR